MDNLIRRPCFSLSLQPSPSSGEKAHKKAEMEINGQRNLREGNPKDGQSMIIVQLRNWI
jgi:hypothetical protein